MKKGSLILCLALLALKLFAQEILQGDMNVWFLLQDRISLCQKWSITNELHLRNNNFFHTTSQFLERPSIDYHFRPDIEFSLGYTFIRATPVLGNVGVFYRNENNLWAQLFQVSKIGRFRFQHRLRQEFRWVDHVEGVGDASTIIGNDYYNRFRYRFVVIADLFHVAHHSLFIQFFNELWVNEDAALRFTNFARNWMYCGAGLKIKEAELIQVGFMHQRDFIKSSLFSSTPIMQLTFIRNFELKGYKT